MCECAEILLDDRFKRPGDLSRAVANARTAISRNLLEVIAGKEILERLMADDQWRYDVIEIVMRCRSCRSLFKISADTFHGAGSFVRESA